MIGAINGVCIHEEHGLASFAVGEMVYEVHVFDIPRVWSTGESTASELWWVHEHAPQDAPHELYGFREKYERDLFRRLLTVDGVGPKVAQKIVGSQAINRAGVLVQSTAKSVRGVGPKILERLIEEFA